MQNNKHTHICKARQWIPDCVHWWAVVALTLYSPTSYAKQDSSPNTIYTALLQAMQSNTMDP